MLNWFQREEEVRENVFHIFAKRTSGEISEYYARIAFTSGEFATNAER